MGAPIIKPILFLVSILYSLSANEIDVFNILLPTAYHSTAGHAKQLITTSGGCYVWDSTDQTIVAVRGIIKAGEHCQSDSVVSLLHQGPYLSSVYITAKEEEWPAITKIPVRIRDLERISIFTKSRVMNLKEIQNLEIYGFDRENNTFTSLEGLTFEWVLRSVDGQLQKMSLRQSSLYTPLDTRKKLQANGFQSDLLLVKATQVGTVEVTVKCLESEYTSIQDHITLVIQERFEVSPSERVDLLAGSSFQFYLLNQMGDNISLPSPQYVAHIDSQFEVTDSLLVTTPPTDSETRLNVSDQRTSPPFWFDVSVRSYQPDRIEIVSPRQIVIGSQVNYSLEFYRNSRLLVGMLSNLEITAPPGFSIDQESRKITASVKATGKIKIEYQGLFAERQINSVTPVSVILPNKAQLVVLPVGQSYQLRTVGGSGLHRFEIVDGSMARISISGLVTTRTEGETQVTVCDQKNAENFIKLKLVVVGVARINSLEPRIESNVNQFSDMFIRATPKSNLVPYFTECNDAFKKISVRAQGESGIIEVTSIYGVSVETLASLLTQSSDNQFLQSVLNSPVIPQSKSELEKNYELHVREGDITVIQLGRIADEITNYGICSKVIYKGLTEYNGIMQVSVPDAEMTKIQMRLYRELQTVKAGQYKDQLEWLSPDGIQQSITQIYMTPLSSFRWEVRGGPFAWEQATQVYLNGIRDKEGTLTITCPASSESSTNKYIRQIRNPASSELLRPAVQEQELVVHCQLPHKLKVTPLANLPTSAEFSKDLPAYKVRESTIFVHPRQNFYLLIQPITSANGIFYNCSNVDFTANSSVGQVIEIRSKKHYFVLNYSNDLAIQDQINVQVSGASKTVLYPENLRDQPNLRDKIFVVTLEPLQVANVSSRITIPSTPVSTHSFKIDAPGSIKRTYSIRCINDSLLSCTRQGSILNLQTWGTSGLTQVEIIDQTIIGAPMLLLPIHVLEPDTINLRILRQGSNSTSEWVIEGESVEVGVQILSAKKGGLKSQRIPIERIDLEDISLTFEQEGVGLTQIKELQRYYNSSNDQIVIRYLTHTSSKLISEELVYAIKARISKYRASSNQVQLKVFKPVSTKGGSKLAKGSLDSVIAILSSCQRLIQITGGPPQLETQVVTDSGQGLTHRIAKLDQRRYRVEGLRQTENLQRNSITGKEDNLIVIKVQYEDRELASIRYLVDIEEISNFRIVGISQLIVGKQARLLAETEKVGLLDSASCDFRFTWRTDGDSVAVTSDRKRIGVNITAADRLGKSSIELVVSDQNNKLLARAVKEVNVVEQYGDPALPLNDVILIAPGTGITLPPGTSAEEISPCDTNSNDLSIARNSIRAGEKAIWSTKIVKLSAADRHDVAAYVTILVTQICGILLENTDGIINIQRGRILEVEFSLIDCYGRKFPPQLTGVEYRVSTGRRDFAGATIAVSTNRVRIEGHQIGSTIMTIEVVGRDLAVKDVVPLNINVHIEPSHPVRILVGDQVRFTGDQTGETGWESSDSLGLMIDRTTGVALAKQEGQYRIRYTNMEANVTVMQVIGVQKGSGAFTYQPIYSRQEPLTDHANIKRDLAWHCKVLGQEAEYLQAVPVIKASQEIVCQLQHILTGGRLKSSSNILIRVSIERADSGLSISKDFVEKLDSEGFFMVTTDRLIDPDQHPQTYYIVIETRERLDVSQSGGRDQWITANEFNGAKQVVTLDLASRESQLGTWHVILQNKQTWQRQTVTVSRQKLAHSSLEESKTGWKWTDILVLFMALNFLVILGYQIMQKNSPASAYKVY